MRVTLATGAWLLIRRKSSARILQSSGSQTYTPPAKPPASKDLPMLLHDSVLAASGSPLITR